MESTIKRPLSKFQLFLNKVKTFCSKPSNNILIFFAVLLTITVLIPLGYLVFNSFLVHIGEAAYPGESGAVTIRHWVTLLTRTTNDYAKTMFWQPLLNSVGMALVACAIAVLFGGTIAWLITRTNLPFKKFISLVFIFPYIMPSWSIAMFWENFFKTRASSNSVGLLQAITGIGVPNSMVYGFWPCAISLALHYAPFAYILIGGILRNMDANLEEAATILKTSRFKILRKITMPIVMPAILSTILLVFASSVSSYTVPAFLGTPGNFFTLSLRLRYLIREPSRTGQGYALAVILLLFSVVILLINQYSTGKRKSFTTITGKSSQVSLFNLGKAKWPVASVVLVVVIFFTIIPLVSFALESFLRTSGDFSTFTTYYWTTKEQTNTYISGSQGILRNSTIWKAFGNSLLVSLFAAFLAGTFGILIGYSVAKTRGTKLSSFVSNVSFFPYLIPAMSFAAIYLAVSSTQTFSFLYESIPLLVIVASVKFMPFASRSGTSAMLQVSGEIEEAAIVIGVPWHKRMTRILFPIQKSSFISGYLLPFISSMRELSLFVLIAGSGTILTAVLEEYERYDSTQTSNGINLIIIGTVIILNLVVTKLTGASVDKGVGGN